MSESKVKSNKTTKRNQRRKQNKSALRKAIQEEKKFLKSNKGVSNNAIVRRNQIGAKGRKRNNSTDGLLVRYVEGVLKFASTPMPRPVPMPVSVYTFQRVLEFNASPANIAYLGTIEVNPYLDSQIVVRTTPTDGAGGIKNTEFLINTCAVSQYYHPGGMATARSDEEIAFIPPLTYSHQPAINLPFWSIKFLKNNNQRRDVYSFLPDIRNPELMCVQHGPCPYFNIKSGVINATISYKLRVEGRVTNTPEVVCIEYADPDLDGAQVAVTSFDTVLEPESRNVQFTKTIQFNTATNSVRFYLTGFASVNKIDFSHVDKDADHNTVIHTNGTVEVVDIQPESESDVYESIIKAATGYAITGMAATLTNTSPTQFTGGTCYSAIVADDSAMPTGYEEAYTKLSEQPYYKYLGVARAGSHVVWVPEDISELFMREKNEQLRSNRLVLGFKSSWSGASQASWKLVITTRLEVQVNTQLITSVIPPCSTDFMGCLFSAIRENLDILIGENPSHMSRLKTAAKKIAKSPQFKNAVKTIGTAAFNSLSQMAMKSLAAI